MNKVKISITDENGTRNFEYKKQDLISEYSHNPVLYNSVNHISENIESQYTDKDFPVRLLYLVLSKIKENRRRRNKRFNEFVQKEKEIGKGSLKKEFYGEQENIIPPPTPDPSDSRNMKGGWIT